MDPPDEALPKEVQEAKALFSEALNKVKEARLARESAATEAFQLYVNLLSDEKVQIWNKTVEEQCNSEHFVDVFGREHSQKRGKTKEAFDECVMLHLQTVFKYDAAERMLHYISNVLKKPKKLSVRQVFQRVEELNNTLDHLPCIFYSPKATPNVEPVKAFTDCQLANHLYRMVPEVWQAEYEKTKPLPTQFALC